MEGGYSTKTYYESNAAGDFPTGLAFLGPGVRTASVHFRDNTVRDYSVCFIII